MRSAVEFRNVSQGDAPEARSEQRNSGSRRANSSAREGERRKMEMQLVAKVRTEERNMSRFNNGRCYVERGSLD
eukprot:6173949-Pleurochrysis_carterae.AAC.1